MEDGQQRRKGNHQLPVDETLKMGSARKAKTRKEIKLAPCFSCQSTDGHKLASTLYKLTIAEGRQEKVPSSTGWEVSGNTQVERTSSGRLLDYTQALGSSDGDIGINRSTVRHCQDLSSSKMGQERAVDLLPPPSLGDDRPLNLRYTKSFPSTLSPCSVKPQSTICHKDLLGSKNVLNTTLHKSGSRAQAGCRRARGFSTKVHPKEDMEKDDSMTAVKRTRTSIPSNSAEGGDVYTAQVFLPMDTWNCINSVYETKLNDITSDLKLEKRESDTQVSLLVCGSNPARVDTCQRKLKMLADSRHTLAENVSPRDTDHLTNC